MISVYLLLLFLLSRTTAAMVMQMKNELSKQNGGLPRIQIPSFQTSDITDNVFFGDTKTMPRLYRCYFNGQVARQLVTATNAAIKSGKTKLHIQFPPVPNLDEVRFGTPLNQAFGRDIIASDLQVKGGYTPGSDLSRNLVAFANIFWAKQVTTAIGGGIFGGIGSKAVNVYSSEQLNYPLIQGKGPIRKIATLSSITRSDGDKKKANQPEAVICINPGGEETWDRLYNACFGSSNKGKATLVILNNAYSTSYDLGNARGYEDVYYLKRISKGWIYRAYPGPWQAFIEKPDGSTELLKSYRVKPKLGEVAQMVRDESFARYAINNDRFAKGFGARL
jgi:hypothetical protein